MDERCSDVLVFFGATGDLAFREIFPALFALYQRGRLTIPVIGVARSPLNPEQFHQRARDSLWANRMYDERAFAGFARGLTYVSGDYRDAETYRNLDQVLEGFERPLFYMAIPPGMFDTVVRGIRSIRPGPASRLVVEKPFGRNLASARALNGMLLHCFPETSIFRLDHFLAMETVANLLYFRFANMFLQPWWCRDYIRNVQIIMAEDFGVAGRGAFYDEVGALRDVVQNHLFQVLGLLAMEAPSEPDNTTHALHDAQLHTFQNVQTLTLDNVAYGQFDGYRTEKGVRHDSRTETYVAMRLAIDNERWRDVPFYIRTGKCLPVTCTEVLVTLKTQDLPMLGSERPLSNTLRFRLDPGMQIALGVQIKEPGPSLSGRTEELVALYEEPGGMRPYERLLGDAIRGDDRLFTRSANMEAAWRIVDDILDRDAPLPIYAPGSWGPVDSDRVLLPGDTWHIPARVQRHAQITGSAYPS